jgi:glycosyl hydrolase family 66
MRMSQTAGQIDPYLRLFCKVGGVGNTCARYRAWAIIFVLLTALRIEGKAQTTGTATTAGSEQASLPSWLNSGTIRFARFDGGPIESQKALRSAWAAGFSPRDLEVLTNLYGTHGDRMIDLLLQAKINFVWVTYSVGFSWKDEEAQRAAVREIVKKLHAHGIKAAAYMCATTVFWESLFKDDPQSVKWIMIRNDGVPYRYSDGRDAMRFVADIDSLGWVEYQKHRVGAIIDDGFDAIFFDNPNLDEHPNEESSVVHFFDQLLNYARREKQSNIPFFTNLGVHPSFAVLNRQMDFIFTEGWVEPGAWQDHWEVSNIRRDRLIRGLNPGLKPIVSEYSHFHKGDRNDSYLGARAVKLAIAEAAAFGTSYTWDMEGPFDAALVARDRKALESWAAIGQYNGFLADHTGLYADAENVVPWIVLLPDSLDPDFDWTGSATRLDFLARNNVLGDFKFANRVTKADLAAYQGVIVPASASLSAEQKEMIHDYQREGGRMSVFAESSSANGLSAEILAPSSINSSKAGSAEAQVMAEINSLAPDATHIEIENPTSDVLANVTSAQSGGTLVVHLLNYGQTSVGDLKIKFVLGKAFQNLAGRKPSLLSPDAGSPVFRDVHWHGSTLEVTLASIDTYSIIVVQ